MIIIVDIIDMIVQLIFIIPLNTCIFSITKTFIGTHEIYNKYHKQ